MMRRVYIGQYSNGQDCGILSIGVDEATGKIVRLNQCCGYPNTLWIVPSHDGTRLYAARDGGITVFDTTRSELRPVADYGLVRTQPCHMSLSSDGKRLYFAEYTDAICGIVELDSGAVLTAMLEGCGPDPRRQTAAHAHCAVETPDGRHMCVADLGSDSIWLFDSKSLALECKMETMPPGAGPRHIAFHPNGKFAYIVFELANIIAAYRYVDGKLEHIQTLPLLPENFSGQSQAAALKISGCGKMLFATNRGHDSAVAFRIDPDSGKLAAAAHSPLGGNWPRDLTLLPGGRIAVGCLEREGKVRTYSFDAGANLFTPLPFSVKMQRPVVAATDPSRNTIC